MKRIFYLIALSNLILTNIAAAQNDSIRKQFFPKIEAKPNILPNKKNTWVFIMAGQSNMAGRGLVESKDTVISKRVFTINKNNEIIWAKEPLHFYEPNLTGLDCGLSFAKTLLKKVPDDVQILLIPTAVGGSSLRQWTGDSVYRNVKLLTNFTGKVHFAMDYGDIKAILWHQGESDANKNDIPFYTERVTNLFKTFRNIVGNEQLPIIIGELGSYSKTNDDWQTVNKMIHGFASKTPQVSVIKTADLKHKGDNIHFNSKGQRTIGKRFAKAFLSKKN